MKKVTLDVRSGEKNSPSTGLCLRRVSPEVVGGRRIGYENYETWGSLGDVVLIASGDGTLGLRDETLSLSYGWGEGGKHYYYTGLRAGRVSRIEDAEGVSLRVLYGGSVVESESGSLEVATAYGVGIGFWWSRNDEVVRFSYEGGRFELLGGGAGRAFGRYGEVEIRLGSLDGELYIGDEVYEVGGELLPIVSSADSLDETMEGVVTSLGVVVLSERHLGSEVRWLGGSFIGGGEVLSGDYLSPPPRGSEHPLLREAGYGYLEVLEVETEDDFSDVVLRGVVELCRSTGRVRHSVSSGVLYEGCVLSREVLVEGVSEDLGFSIGGVEIGVISVPDGSGLEPALGEGASGFESNGSGLVWAYKSRSYWVEVGEEILPVKFVDELPKVLESGYGYLLGRRVYLSSVWARLVAAGGHRLLDGSFRIAYSSVVGQVAGGSGVVRLTNGDEFSVSLGSLSGDVGGVYVERGHVFIREGYEIEGGDLLGLGLGLGLETGLVFELTSPRVAGYYDFSDEQVGVVGGLPFQFLDFAPRLDFRGYDFGSFFRVGDEVLGGLEYHFGETPNGFMWVSEVETRGEIREESNTLVLEYGVREGTTSVEVSQDGVGTEVLVEGVSYEVDTASGVLRLKEELGSELGRGLSLVASGMEVELDEVVEGVRAGDWLYLEGGSYYKVESVLGGGVLRLSGVVEGSGVWVMYRGYREGYEALETPDKTRLVGESFEEIRAGDVVVAYKVLESLDAADLSKRLYLRSGGVETELTVLVDENVVAPYRVSGEHLEGGFFEVLVGGVSYRPGVEGEGGRSVWYEGGRLVFGVGGVEDNSWVEQVVLRRLPREGEVEVSYDGLGLSVSYDEVLEVLEGVQVQPELGLVRFSEPLESGVGLEVSYEPVDGGGAFMREVVSFSVLGEVAEHEGGLVYRYGDANVDEASDLTVFVDSEIVSNYVRRAGGEIRFKGSVGGTQVLVNYSTLKSKGGEGFVRLSSGVVSPRFELEGGSNIVRTPKSLLGVVSLGDVVRLGLVSGLVSNVTSSGIELTRVVEKSVSESSLKVLRVPSLTYEGEVLQSSFRQLEGVYVEGKKQTSRLLLRGDYRRYLESGSLVIAAGQVYMVLVVDLAEGGKTELTVEGLLPFSYNGVVELYVSLRRVLDEGATRVPLQTNLLSGSSHKLISFRDGVGSEVFDYRIEGGEVVLVDRVLGANEQLYLLHTSSASLSPLVLEGGRVSYPRFKASYKVKGGQGAYEGLPLLSTCVVESPDTFGIRVVSDEAYTREVEGVLRERVSRGRGYGGKLAATQTPQGLSVGLYDLLAEDVIARSRLSLYHGLIAPLEESISLSTGLIVGDQDGGFKYTLEQGSYWGGVGLEDPITRELEPRNVLSQMGVSLDDVSVSSLKGLIEEQRVFVENDVDDIVMTGFKKQVTTDMTLPYPHKRLRLVGSFQSMSEPSSLSRLYPTQAEFFTYRLPGELFFEREGLDSTNGAPLATVSNPSMGQLKNVTSITLKKRGARFRVVSYSRVGYPTLEPLTTNKPTFLLSAVELKDFPFVAGSDLPDVSEFISNGGEVHDVVTGWESDIFNGLRVGDKVSLSVDGEMYPILNTLEQMSLDGQSASRYARVSAIYHGCLVVLEGLPSALHVNGFDLYNYLPNRGDTLLQTFAADFDEETTGGVYRIGTDVGLDSKEGLLIDITLPSLFDPNYPLRELRGQNIPDEYEALEGKVSFTNTRVEPFRFPALDGEPLNDYGVRDIPFQARLSERDVLSSLQPNLNDVRLSTLNPISGVEEAVYPDEVREDSTLIEGDAIETLGDFSDLSGDAVQTPRLGDLIVLAPDYSGALGSASTGVLELSKVEGTSVLPVHFETPCLGAEFELLNQLVVLNSDPLQGALVQETLSFNQGTNSWSESEVVITFTNTNSFDDIMQKLFSDTGFVEVNLHDPITHVELATLTLSWTSLGLSLFSSVGGGVASEVLNLSVGFSASSLTITQSPIPNPLTIAEEPQWPTSGYSSWFTEIWSMIPLHASYTTSGTNKITTSAAAFGFRLSTRWPSENGAGFLTENYVLEDRLSFHVGSGVLTDQVNVLDDTATYEPTFYLYNSIMEVKEEGGAGTQLIKSFINSNSRLGNGYVPFVVVDDQTLRVKPLFDVSRAGDRMSMLVGSEVNDSDVILRGTATHGLLSPDATEDTSPRSLRNITATEGSLANVEIGDLVYLKSGHNAGVHRVRRVTTESVGQQYTETLGESDILPVVFPLVTGFVDNGDGTGLIETNSSDLLSYFNETGEMVILLNENYKLEPYSDQNNKYDVLFYKSHIRVSYDSIEGSSFIFSFVPNVNPVYGDGEEGGQHPTSLNEVELDEVLGSGGQTVAGIHRVPFNLLATGLVPYEVFTTFSLDYSYRMLVAGGLEGSNDLSNVLRDECGVVRGFLLDGAFPDIVDAPQGNIYGTAFFTPGDKVTFIVIAEASMCIDPDFPRLLRDYRGVTPSFFGDGTTQLRSMSELVGYQNLPAWSFHEETEIIVRRVRRFTPFMRHLTRELEGIRYLYEQRRGLIDTLTYSGTEATLVSAPVDVNGVADTTGKDTQVGSFVDVVSRGDVVLGFDGSGELGLKMKVTSVAEGELRGQVVYGGQEGLASYVIESKVYPVPHEQSFKTFFEHGFEAVYQSSAASGVSVVEVDVLEDLNVDFRQLIVGDPTSYYIVIDPQGVLDTGEIGAPPLGDSPTGVLGAPSRLDDNRGAYKVISIEQNRLFVEFVSGSVNASDFLPLVGGVESNSLRVTQGAVGGTHLSTEDSVHPFGYRLVKRIDVLQATLAESFLFLRERLLSWMEKVRLFNQVKADAMTWAEYEAERAFEKVGEGDPTHPSNNLLFGTLEGEISTFPYSSDRLSLLDRRLLIEDPQLEREGEVLREGLVSVLEADMSSMDLRDKRYAWLKVRTDLLEGTLPRVNRLDLSNPNPNTKALEDIK
jgi:hypothetical protein